MTWSLTANNPLPLQDYATAIPNDLATINFALAERGRVLAASIAQRHTLRAQRLRDLDASVAEWQRASGTDRRYWRTMVRHQIAEWREYHEAPERVAFQRAVAAARQRRAAA